jgi:hypothetical protein
MGAGWRGKPKGLDGLGQCMFTINILWGSEHEI